MAWISEEAFSHSDHNPSKPRNNILQKLNDDAASSQDKESTDYSFNNCVIERDQDFDDQE